eukprot:Phypoly_transcript_00904.p1 GENE.Phypoly_transcript_00904~~Phypoly_transcript_00904.p1  ORF type:complete len:1018 (+),score=223.88 Phypoly_transcript_00904:209-3262(+)
MSEGEESEGDAFEIIDHTVASPWERFVARIEEILRGWSSAMNEGLKEGEDLEPLEENVIHANRTYTLTYVRAPRSNFDDPKYSHLPQRLRVFADESTDFTQNGHDIQRWFGVEDFLALWPISDSGTDMNEASLLLSSLTIAADSTRCYVPLFVPIGDRYEGRYTGYMVENGFCARFSCENYQTGTKQGQFGNMENLVEYFHKQLNANRAVNRDLTPFTTVSARFTYSREDWYDEWRGKHVCEVCQDEKRRLLEDSPKENAHLSTNYNARANSDIYWGPLSDPLLALQLGAVWQQDAMPKNRFWVDNKIRTDFRPKGAPVWNLQASFRDFEKACPLTMSLRVLLTAYVESLEAPSLHLFAKPEDLASAKKKNAPDSPNEQKQGLVQVVETLTKTITSLNSPIVPTQQELETIVRELFAKTGNEEIVEDMQLHQVKSLSLKAAPPFTLVADLACRMLDMQCLPAIALLWIEFVKEVRWCWEHCVPLPQTPVTHVDPSACLIYQKLQMLNYCINRKVKERKRKKPRTQKTQGETAETGDLENDPPEQKPTLSDATNPVNSNSSKNPTRAKPRIFDNWDEFDDPAPRTKPAPKKGEKTEEDFFRILNEPNPESKTAPIGQVTPPALSLDKREEKGEEKREKKEEPEEVASPDGWDDNELEGLSSESEEDDEDFQDAQDAEKPILSLDGWDDLPDLDLSTQYLLYRDRSIVAPETQDSGIMTEDMLKEQEEIFKSLGTSEEAALIRAKLQTPSLKSDMESFKAANEGCVLEDFVRWYSPRDWVTSESDNFDEGIIKQSDAENGGEIRGKGMGRDGHLSARMRLPGNLWRLLWRESQAVPANKQAPLFKHATEAEKVLHYLENVTLPDLIQQLISVVLNVILYTFKPTHQHQPQKKEEDEEEETKEKKTPHCHTTPPLGVDLPPFIDVFDNFLRAIDSYWPEHYIKDKQIEVENLTSLWQEFQALECMAAKATSLLQKVLPIYFFLFPSFFSFLSFFSFFLSPSFFPFTFPFFSFSHGKNFKP